jgi:hypothetical protein
VFGMIFTVVIALEFERSLARPIARAPGEEHRFESHPLRQYLRFWRASLHLVVFSTAGLG